MSKKPVYARLAVEGCEKHAHQFLVWDGESHAQMLWRPTAAERAALSGGALVDVSIIGDNMPDYTWEWQPNQNPPFPGEPMQLKDSNANSNSLKIDLNGNVAGFGQSWSFSGQVPASMQILPMIEARIRESIAPEVEKMRARLVAVINCEAATFGMRADFNGSHQFADKIAKAYAEKLVADRIAALVDSLVPPKDAAP